MHYPLVEALIALGAGERHDTSVQQGVPLEAGGVGEGGAALLADVGPEGGLPVVVRVLLPVCYYLW